MKIKKVFYILVALIVSNTLLTAVSMAQEQLFDSFNQVSARAAGMGQAYTALVDDPTAIYWNPAAMSLMKRGYGGIMLKHGYRSYSSVSGYPANTDSWQTSSNSVSDLGFIGLVLPFHGGIANTTLGFSVRRFTPFPQDYSEQVATDGGELYNWYSTHEGAINIFSLAISLRLKKQLSVGGAINF